MPAIKKNILHALSWLPKALLLLVALAAMHSHAEEFFPDRSELVGGRFLPLQYRAAPSERTRAEGLEETLRTAWSEFKGSVNVSSFRIPTRNVLQSYFDVLNNSEEFFYVFGGLSYSSSGNYVTEIRPVYLYGKTEAAAMRAELDAAVEAALKCIEDGMSDIDKALALHDHIAVNCSYDVSLERKNNANIYGALVEGQAVCSGYAQAYSYLLKKQGIRSHYVASTPNDHAWNLITIDGQDYHVDVTWDDAVGLLPNEILHSFFLLDDEAVRALDDHDVWDDESLSGKSNRFNAYFWKNAARGMIPWHSGHAYAFDDNGNLMECDTATGSTRTVHAVPDRWRSPGGGYYTRKYCQIVKFNGMLLFNGPDSIYRWEPSSGKAIRMDSDISTDDGYAYGLYLNNGDELFWRRSTSPSVEGDFMELAFQMTVTLPLRVGWNLVGVPFEPNASSAAELASLNAMGYNPATRSYRAVRSFKGGSAYWIFSKTARELKLSGSPAAAPLAEGWNFISSDRMAGGAFFWNGKGFVAADEADAVPNGSGVIIYK